MLDICCGLCPGIVWHYRLTGAAVAVSALEKALKSDDKRLADVDSKALRRVC